MLNNEDGKKDPRHPFLPREETDNYIIKGHMDQVFNLIHKGPEGLCVFIPARQMPQAVSTVSASTELK